jgi:hypothetical protein
MNMTQKQTIAVLKAQAAKLFLTVAIRKNSYGEYEARVRREGVREPLLNYFTDAFDDAVGTVKVNLARAQEFADAQERKLDAEYEQALAETVRQFNSLFLSYGCRISRFNEYVNLWSPKTGSHNLTMRRGVRPVSDLVAHACGFIEAQTHVR